MLGVNFLYPENTKLMISVVYSISTQHDTNEMAIQGSRCKKNQLKNVYQVISRICKVISRMCNGQANWDDTSNSNYKMRLLTSLQEDQGSRCKKISTKMFTKEHNHLQQYIIIILDKQGKQSKYGSARYPATIKYLHLITTDVAARRALASWTEPHKKLTILYNVQFQILKQILHGYSSWDAKLLKQTFKREMFKMNVRL